MPEPVMPASPSLNDLVSLGRLRCTEGAPPTPEELCADHPQLLEALLQRIQALQAMDAFLGNDPTSTPRQDHSTPQAPEVNLVASVRREAEAAPPQVKVPGYEILEVLGEGGMGVVYKARHTQLRRLVALKMIRHGAHGDSEHRRRFRIEAEAVAQLHHANIVQIYEVGEGPAARGEEL
jgi:serine/threonine-protein kinase